MVITNGYKMIHLYTVFYGEIFVVPLLHFPSYPPTHPPPMFVQGLVSSVYTGFNPKLEGTMLLAATCSRTNYSLRK